MSIKTALKESLCLYKKNFGPLLLAQLVALVLRAMALTPVLFLADKALAPLAFIAIPLYLLIVLPARQNYAIALQDMMCGDSVFSLQLISTQGYWKKLWRGLKGTLCMLLWSSLTIAGISALYVAMMGLVDFITLMRIFAAIGGDFVSGVLMFAAAVAGSCLLILLGCAVHSGTRHAIALGDRKLLRGNRLRLMALWFLGLVLVIPFAGVVVAAMGDYALTVIAALKNFQLPSFSLNVRQAALLVGGAAVLLFPLLPLKSLLPAVYLRKVKEARDAQA